MTGLTPSEAAEYRALLRVYNCPRGVMTGPRLDRLIILEAKWQSAIRTS